MTTAPAPPALRQLYVLRFGFAVVWAALLIVTATPFDVAATVLLVLYPLVDAAAAVVDARSSRDRVLILNIVISALAALGLALAGGPAAVLRVWGVWAIVAGIVQLVVALRRRRFGGQWAMIISGAISVLAGGSFLAMAAQPGPSLAVLAGYAVLGGVFFLVSAIRLGRPARVHATR